MTIRELAPGETALAYAAMRALRPQLASEEEFVRRVDELQRPQGYRLVAAVEGHGSARTTSRASCRAAPAAPVRSFSP